MFGIIQYSVWHSQEKPIIAGMKSKIKELQEVFRVIGTYFLELFLEYREVLPMINTYKMRFEVFRMLKNCFSFENVKLFSFYGPKS